MRARLPESCSQILLIPFPRTNFISFISIIYSSSFYEHSVAFSAFMMKHQYEALSATEQGTAVELELPASPDTLVDQTEDDNQPTPAPARVPTMIGSRIIRWPQPDSTVKEVREYLILILNGCFDIPLEEAQNVAANWRDALGDRYLAMSREDMSEKFGERYAGLILEYQDKRQAQETVGGEDRVIAVVIVLVALAFGFSFLVYKATRS